MPTIYGYTLPDVADHNGYIKIGYTDREYTETRIKEQPHTATIPFRILFKESAMRSGKTFATYQLARAMDFKRILILTFKPAVESAWQEDMSHHVDFAGWQFVSNKEAMLDAKQLDEQFEACDKAKPI